MPGSDTSSNQRWLRSFIGVRRRARARGLIVPFRMPAIVSHVPRANQDEPVEPAPAPFSYPEPPAEIASGWLTMLKVFGPGALIASVTVGTGETIFAPRVGAIFGYTMFWVVMAAVLGKAVLVYTGAR